MINSFQSSIPKRELESIVEYVEYNEFGLAIEILSDTIYELNVPVDDYQQTEILGLSKHFGVNENYHKFIGKQPPYPDLRTGEQIAFDDKRLEPSIENIKYLATNGFRIEAVKMHRALFGTSLEEATKKVNEFVKN